MSYYTQYSYNQGLYLDNSDYNTIINIIHLHIFYKNNYIIFTSTQKSRHYIIFIFINFQHCLETHLKKHARLFKAVLVYYLDTNCVNRIVGKCIRIKRNLSKSLRFRILNFFF